MPRTATVMHSQCTRVGLIILRRVGSLDTLPFHALSVVERWLRFPTVGLSVLAVMRTTVTLLQS